MPQVFNVQGRATLAEALVRLFNMVEHGHSLYVPVHFLTGEYEGLAGRRFKPVEKVWHRLSLRELRDLANDRLDLLFAAPSEFASFVFMCEQFSTHVEKATGILVRIEESHVAQLNGAGELVPVTGDFVPNYLNIPYKEDAEPAEKLFQIMAGWLNSEEQAHSLLYHLATMLQPTFSARKYVLLIGEGYNGKGTLIKMLHGLLGEDNISGMTRQDMAAKEVTLPELNSKMLNLVYDGPKDFLKDSSTEKTLIAGEPIWLRRLYENGTTKVQTYCLFVEALNDEPNTSDKSPALQKRLTRFKFPNVYEDDPTFADNMQTPEMLAAFLYLLRQHWVNKEDLKDKLRLTAESLDLQLQAVWNVSPMLRYLEWVSGRTPETLQDILDGKMLVNPFLENYRVWLETNGYKNMEDDYLLRQMTHNFVTDRKTFRLAKTPGGEKKPTSARYIKTVLPDTLNAINMLLAGASLEGVTADDLEVIRELE